MPSSLFLAVEQLFHQLREAGQTQDALIQKFLGQGGASCKQPQSQIEVRMPSQPL